MRKIMLIGLLFTFSNLTAQRTVIKNIATTEVSDVLIHLKFANTIEVKNWNKNTLSVKATVNINDNKENEIFSLLSKINRNLLEITSDYGDFYKGKTTYIKGIQINNYVTVSVNYVIYIPKNIDVTIKSISGNVVANNITNNITLDLISGNISVQNHSKKMVLNTISGDIDISITDATFKAKTLTGRVYSNLDINNYDNEKSSFGSTFIGTVKKGNSSLKLNTVSGDIYLRKI